MNVLLIGQYGAETTRRIRAVFPADWTLAVAAAEKLRRW